MKFFKKFGKLNIIITILAVLFLVLPTVITYNLVKKNDDLDKQMDDLVFSSNKTDGIESPVNPVVDIASMTEVKEDTVGNVVLEKDTTSITPLTTSETPTDALMIASDLDADVDEALETEGIEEVEEIDEEEEVPLNGKKVYLTFDDGPSDYTGELLDILAEYDVKATFFVVRNFDKADMLRRIADEGHTIGLHSASHIYSKIYADQTSFEADVQGVHSWVQHLTGIDTRLYRFPGGSSNAVSNVPISDCIEYLHNNGYEYYDWNAESQDAENLYLSPEQLNSNVMASVRNNEGDSIVLMHDLDDHYNTVLALPDLIETLKSEGYELCTLDENSPKCQHYIIEE